VEPQYLKKKGGCFRAALFFTTMALFSIQLEAKFTGKAEHHHFTRRQGHGGFSFWITALAGFFVIGFKFAETADQQGSIFFNRLLHDIQQLFHQIFDFYAIFISFFVNSKTLTKADIVEAIYEKTDKNRVEVKNLVENLLNIMKQAMKKDKALLLSGFGKFEAYDKKARKGRNPKTDATMLLPPRKVVVFRLSRNFRHELNGE
jgi:integration host factor subunit alpha